MNSAASDFITYFIRKQVYRPLANEERPAQTRQFDTACLELDMTFLSLTSPALLLCRDAVLRSVSRAFSRNYFTSHKSSIFTTRKNFRIINLPFIQFTMGAILSCSKNSSEIIEGGCLACQFVHGSLSWHLLNLRWQLYPITLNRLLDVSRWRVVTQGHLNYL